MIPNLTLIGESINDSVPSTQAFFEANDIDGLIRLAKSQQEAGAGYIDVNVGLRTAEFMADLVRRIEPEVSVPLSIDSPAIVLAEAGLAALSPAGHKPILNSISLMRTEMFELVKIRPFRPILLVSENASAPCFTAEETYDAAKQLLQLAAQHGISASDCIFDPGIAPVGTDMDGNLKRLMNALRLMSADPAFKGAHYSVGLSNFTVMLPPTCTDGSPVKSPLESAFLTRAMPLGLDHIIGSVKRKYAILPEGHPALQCFDDCAAADGPEGVERVLEFYS